MKQLDPKSVWLFFFKSIPIWIVFSIFISQLIVPLFFFVLLTPFSLQENFFFGAVLSVFILIITCIVLSYVWAKLSYRFYWYELTELGFKKEHGVIWKKYVTIPYDRIQNVDIYRGPIARLLGLSDLQIQTAGSITAGSYGAFSEGNLPGLSREIAEQLRDELISRARRQTSQSVAQGL